MVRRFEYQLFADYFQFYLHDEAAVGDLSQSWTPEAVDRLLALAPGTIGVGTVRNMVVPVSVEIADSEPEDIATEWDQINDCSINIESGRMVVAGCTDYLPDAARIDVVPGTYRVRVFYGRLGTVSGNRLEGDDKYKVVLWPGPTSPLRVIKQRNRPDESSA